MKKQYKIQLPKGKKVTMTNVDFEDGVMTVNVELENRTNFHEAIHNEVCGVFGKINNQLKEVLKHNGSKREKIEEMAKESIKELEKDCPDIWDRCMEKFSKRFHESCEKVAQATDELSKAMDEAQKELNQEQKYEPKDGDFVYVKSRLIPYVTKYSFIGIFCDIIKDEDYTPILLMYASLKDDNRLVYGNSIEPYNNSEYIRPATEEEKKLLIDKLSEVGKRWNEETKTIEDVRWRADYQEEFYYVDCFGKVAKEKRRELFHFPKFDSKGRLRGIVDDDSDTQMYNVGNYFKTREAAEKAAEQIRDIFKNSKAE